MMSCHSKGIINYIDGLGGPIIELIYDHIRVHSVHCTQATHPLMTAEQYEVHVLSGIIDSSLEIYRKCFSKNVRLINVFSMCSMHLTQMI